MTISPTHITLRRRWLLLALLTLALVMLAGQPAMPTTLPALGGGGSAAPRPADFTLRIPGIDLEVAVQEALIRGDTWDFSGLTHQAAHLQLTAFPGEGTNVVIGAHYELAGRAPGPFIALDDLTAGEPIFVEYQGHVYVYEVSATLIVTPEDIQIAYRTPDEMLTLLTCYDYRPASGDYARRYVVRAALVEVRPAA